MDEISKQSAKKDIIIISKIRKIFKEKKFKNEEDLIKWIKSNYQKNKRKKHEKK